MIISLLSVLIIGDSQLAGRMGQLLEMHYKEQGVQVFREHASGKGVRYFSNAIRQNNNSDFEVEIISYNQYNRIKEILSRKLDYIIIAALGGNDAYRGCCTGPQRRRMLNMYKLFFKRLCSYDTIIIFNGSPPANRDKHPVFDNRRKMIDDIQMQAALGTCVIFNSMRGMRIQADRDGYHYNRSAKLYLEHLLAKPGMRLNLN